MGGGEILNLLTTVNDMNSMFTLRRILKCMGPSYHWKHESDSIEVHEKMAECSASFCLSRSQN